MSRKGAAFLQPNTPQAFVANTTATVNADDVHVSGRLDTVQLDASIVPWREALRRNFGHDAAGSSDGLTEVAVVDAAPVNTYRMKSHHLLQGASEFDWVDRDAVASVLQPRFAPSESDHERQLVSPADLPAADRAAYDQLMALWREQAKARQTAEADAAALAAIPQTAHGTAGAGSAEADDVADAGEATAVSDYLLRAQMALQGVFDA